MASSCVTPSKRASISERQVFECIISEANACPSKKPAEYTQCFHKFVENYDLCKNDNNLNMSLTFVGPWNRRLPNIAVISPSGTKYGSRNDDGNLIAQKWSSNVST